jgi:LPS export ABC transporter permease LptF
LEYNNGKLIIKGLCKGRDKFDSIDFSGNPRNFLKETMKILKFYILREFIPPYLGSMAFFTMLLLLERVLSFVRLVARGYATIFDLLVLIFYSIPPTLALTMPMSTIMGALISIGRLSHDSEITAMRASGIRLSSIFISLYIAGIFIGGVSFYFNDYFVPLGNIKFRALYQKLTIARPDLQIEVHSINKLTGEITLLVEEVDEKTGDLINVTLFEKREAESVKTITAQKGWFLTMDEEVPYIQLRLANGTIIDTKDKTGRLFDTTVFQIMDFNIPLEHKEMKKIVKTPRDMSMKELIAGMDEFEKGSRSYNIHIMEYHKKIAIPFACVLFVFLGTPFAITRGRSGKGLGLGIGVLIIFFYYIFLLTLERMGKYGKINPALAIWLPNILFFIAGVMNLVRKGKV